ncbi:MAG: putative collagen-binding domain-containing protein, partial [Bacteroidales bacterium]
ADGKGHGELEKLAVTSGRKVLVYCPDNSKFTLKQEPANKLSWFNPKSGESLSTVHQSQNEISPPDGWEDAVLVLE